jgi:predicted nuclease with TOPRIM domain
MAVVARETWTDERLDDLKGHMDEGFREVKAELRSTRAELKGELGELRGSIEKLSDRLDRLNYTLIAGLIGLLATHYFG